jgi:DNA-binding CsgD family transcriptional regulator/tetratricopeptide (TPR) repeat protein
VSARELQRIGWERRIFRCRRTYLRTAACVDTGGVEARASGAFVGRVRELWELEGALASAQAGTGTTVLVAGEAGIGKTRLATELTARARAAGFETLLGRSIDLVGTELPYQPFIEALRPLGELQRVDGQAPGSQLRVFEETLGLLTDRAATAPVLLVLEDLHWADISTLDLAVFLAHNLDDRRVLLLATYRADELSSAERVRRLADGVRRSGSALMLELGPLEPEELTELLAAHFGAPPPATLTGPIVARSEGNPFFAEELLSAADNRQGELPRGLRDLLLERVARLDPPTQGLLRLAAAAGRDVGYPLLLAAAGLPEHEVRESLRSAVDHGVLVADQAAGSFRFRHALLAEAIYSTILPGEREELHGRLAEELARRGAAAPAELAPQWAAAGRAAEALAASVVAARETEAVFGLAEAHAHVERALALWDAVPDAAAAAQLDLAELCSWGAELAGQTGAAPRAVELGRRAIELVGDGDPLRSARLYQNLGRYLHASGHGGEAALTAFERAVELVPAVPPSPARAQALAARGHALSLLWRHEESLPICEQALALAREVGDRPAELRALTVHGVCVAHLGRADEGLEELRLALQLAEQAEDPVALQRAYVYLTDVLTIVGRPRESARVAATALDALRPYGIENSTLVSNWIEALVAIGEWDEADRVSAAALRSITASYPHQILFISAALEVGRGDFEGARAHYEAALLNLSEDFALAWYNAFVTELALWERRWTDADEAVRDGLARVRRRDTALMRVRLCAQGVRTQAELAEVARARRDTDALRDRLARARNLRADARRAAAEASAVTADADGWGALAEAEYARARGVAQPRLWSEAADTWERLERPPVAAYCRWRQAEALVAAGAPRPEASVPLRQAHAVATRIGARPLLRELELLAERARLDPTTPDAGPRDGRKNLEEQLGLTPREAEVLTLVARGLTNREIADALVISVRTAGVHVSHILRKLDAPNRIEAAAIAQRLSPPPSPS